MQWTFKFATYDRRELNDYEYTITVEELDSYNEAIKKAVKELPLGEEDNPYSRAGVEWHIQSVSVDDSVSYKNDK
tara:strand:+ start:845 stop:1069 length:225 start_codon:yes stop_codon:yes gene_type:complete